MPLRDDRRGRRATLDGDTPLRPSFETEEPLKNAAPPSPSAFFALFETILCRLRRPVRNDEPRQTSAPSAAHDESLEPQPSPPSTPPLHAPAAQPADCEEWWRGEQRSFAAEPAALTGDRLPAGLADAGCAASLATASPPATDGTDAAHASPPATDGTDAAHASLGTSDADGPAPAAADGTTPQHAPLELSTAQPRGPELCLQKSAEEYLNDARAEPLVVHAVPTPLTPELRPQQDAEANDAQVEPLVVHALRTPLERIVPITRLPLRPQSRAIEWPQHLPDGGAELGDEDRHALLRELAKRAAEPQWRTMLDQAYREEETEGRVLALQALLRGRYDARDTFVEALHVGTDEERSLAVDALIGLGLRDELVPAFSDRVEAIAAKAALGYVGTNLRSDYRAVLERHVDSARCNAVLALLAGVLT